ncbi:hypothetical protein HYH03_008201 [Edaphochlamys debaryana]|uniref:Acyltransferase n=1 Tax=Edaphochlamys debaryana TaxID=47281 RepID=A0A835Y1W0_9CHLO|nr:hypothetical protein HYH03_008201 [Edaphochlamys debaryana]|eukprot:KAG2493687.1 hypothetical protein HYH03_008201 [Edaphochlamys debaryana]
MKSLFELALKPGQLPGRLTCFWFLLTVITNVWYWPLAFCVILYTRSLVGAATICILVLYNTVGPGKKAAGNCSWPPLFRRLPYWAYMARYFSARIVKTEDLPPEKNYMFVSHPHGVIGLSTWVNFATEATGVSKVFPGIEIHVATLGSNFVAPGMREYVLMHGLCDASRDTLKALLGSGKPGRSVVLVVGGAAEALLAAPGTYDLILNSRKGFIKLALQTGASLVPLLGFGEPDTYMTWVAPKGTTAARVLKVLKDWLGFSTPIIWGVGVFGGKGLMPLPAQLTSVVGAPVHVDKVENPSQEQIDALHAKYVAALQRTWDDHVDKYGKGVKKPLTIVA